ncbi:hypothetical protein CF111_21445 [Aeromonas sobria]|uniref:hypothetical protein n=1 Tax=Aeromonas sobria TaxID=646 RepID=UPI00111B2E88|nr:hypothetical protein [Aeromonas sobria]TNJ14203.1 hypothetical protein CF111_21445 [Aeromonas sobria]
MWKALKWIFICWALLLILSDIQISTSLYKYEDNRVLINFPRWEAKDPWGTLEWHEGRISSHWYGLEGKPKPAAPQI